MYRFVSKSTRSSNWILQLYNFYSTSSTKSISLQNGTQDSFTVRYLMNQFGFSMQRAALASSKYAINFDKPDKPDSVISFLKYYGFSDSQIRKVVSAYPRILSSKPQKTLLPKIQFFRSKGCSDKDVARILSVTPDSFRRSLENYIVPSFNFIKDFIGSEKDAILAVSNDARMLLKLESNVKPNIEILLGAGMYQSAIAHLLKTRPLLFVHAPDKVKESVKQVQNMGIDPRYFNYGLALAILTVTRKSTWNKRMEAYKRWGCSEEDVLRSFKISPNIMKISEEKFNGIMSLFVHEIGWKSSEVVKRYFMMSLSLKKRLIPRWSVYQELISKGLVKKEINMSTVFKMKEDLFLEKFVNCYRNEAPFLLKLYIEKQASK